MEKECPRDYFSVELSRERITSTIYRRLCQWGGTRELQNWFPLNKVRKLQEIVHRFVHMDNLEVDLLNKLWGWECALGQIIDTDDPKVMADLPYILTAYIYNFGEPATVRDRKGSKKEGNTHRNRYIYSYLQKIRDKCKSDDEDEDDDDYFFGVEPGEGLKEELVGVGALLNRSFRWEDSRQKHQLKVLSENFVFPKLAKVPAGLGLFYLVPVDSKGEFQKRLDDAKTFVPGHNLVLQGYILGDGRELYSDAFWCVFLSWCHTLLQGREQGCEEVRKVDFLHSTWLMLCAMQDDEGAEFLKKKMEIEGEVAAQKWTEDKLEELYSDRCEETIPTQGQEEPGDDDFRYGPGSIIEDDGDNS